MRSNGNLSKRAEGSARHADDRSEHLQRNEAEPIAVVCADLHFSHKPPAARANEPDWYDVMHHAWSQIANVALERTIPILIAGDLFDRWNVPPQLLSFVIGLFNGIDVYAIPGQHDLPNHNLHEIHRSAYGVLAAAGAIVDLSLYIESGLVIQDQRFRVYPVPYGQSIRSVGRADPKRMFSVLLCHRYVWTDGTGYVGAPDEYKLTKLTDSIKNYEVVVFGDNHKPFEVRRCKRNVVFNCGTLLRRKRDERSYRPGYGIVYRDGTVERRYLDTGEESWIEITDVQIDEDDSDRFHEFFKRLEEGGPDSLDFREEVRRCLRSKGVTEDIRDEISAIFAAIDR